MTVTLPERTGAHVSLDAHERALRGITKRLITAGANVTPHTIRWWAMLLQHWPNPAVDDDRIAA